MRKISTGLALLLLLNACGAFAGDPAVRDTFVSVTVSGAGFNRSCSGGCSWVLTADASGVFVTSDEIGTESFDLTPPELDRLMFVADDSGLFDALNGETRCPGVVDATMAISATWEFAGTLTSEEALGCAETVENPYFLIQNALVDFHRTHFVCDESERTATFRRALCVLLP